MAVPHVSTNFGDLLDPRFQAIAHDRFNQLPDMLPMLFTFPPDNGRADMRWSQVSGYDDVPEFTGTVLYQDASQGFDTLATHVEFASGIQVERKLFDDDQYNIMDLRPRGLATAAQRTRQKHAARLFNNAFSIDNKFSNMSEGVAMCSDSHTTTTGASTAAGFDNLGTAPLSATAVSAARIQMVGYRGMQADPIQVVPDELWIPPDLFEKAYEIVASMGKLETANNNRNVHEGAYNIHEWNYITDSNNWFMADSAERAESVHWIDRVAMEFAFAEDLDTLIAKWRLYMRYSWAWIDWRWILGSQVS